jgi:GNAT superfamily N-acetyltransferase
MISPHGSTASPTKLRQRWTIDEANGRKDAFYLVRLWHHYFGAEYESNLLPPELAEIAGWTDDDESVAVCGVIARHEDVAVGGGVASVMDHERAVEEMPEGRFDAEALAGERNVWLWFGVVDPAWRGRGIGRELFERRLQWASDQDASMAFAYGWERRDGRTSRPLFEAYDFVPIQRFEDHYAETRDACPDCGAWPNNDVECRCEMTLWARDLPVDVHETQSLGDFA